MMYLVQSMSKSVVLSVAIVLLINQMTAAQTTTSPYRIRSYRLKRSFYDNDCKGIYDKMMYSKVYQVCEDCYNLMRKDKLHSLCRSECFSSEYFKSCLEVLHMQDELKQYEEYIMKLKGLGV